MLIPMVVFLLFDNNFWFIVGFLSLFWGDVSTKIFNLDALLPLIYICRMHKRSNILHSNKMQSKLLLLRYVIILLTLGRLHVMVSVGADCS